MVGAIIVAIIGCIVAGVGWIWILITAFRESTSQGLLCIMPFYAVYYVIKRWSATKKPAIISLVGVGFILLIVGTVYGLMPCYGVKLVITEFMEAVVERDVEAVYGFWSPWSTAEKEEIDEFIESNPEVFMDYERLTINQPIEQSIDGITICSVGGDIIYNGARYSRLSLYALLRKDNCGCWKIVKVRIGNIELGTIPEWYYDLVPAIPFIVEESSLAKRSAKINYSM